MNLIELKNKPAVKEMTLRKKERRQKRLAELREEEYERFLFAIQALDYERRKAVDLMADYALCEICLTEKQIADGMSDRDAWQAILDELPKGVFDSSMLYVGGVESWANSLPEDELKFYSEQKAHRQLRQFEHTSYFGRVERFWQDDYTNQRMCNR